jgi:oligopeptide/dipeptide ABC transporter ATP-binding protein
MLIAEDLRKTFVTDRNLVGRTTSTITAVDGVSVSLSPGSTLAVVGESGCGKSTLAELMLLLQQPDSGSVTLDGEQLVGLSPARLRSVRRALQVVFQDPYSSLDPTQTIGSAIEEPLVVNKVGARSERHERVRDAMSLVRLPSTRDALSRYPSEFSGGQRQRIAIARALVVDPRYVVLDEAVSALDVSTQAQILELLRELQVERDLGYLFISHDLAVVRRLASEVAVMYLGRVVEQAPVGDLYAKPLHPYTAGLLRSVPHPDPRRARLRVVDATIEGEPPDSAARPTGCAFHPRCPHATALCVAEDPQLRAVGDRVVACHHAEDLDLREVPVAL